ncbi:MAG: CvpA family protein [Lachnospiraceae bacterium]|nr:CvpA family protein [Lachnospiraceae bacterium]
MNVILIVVAAILVLSVLGGIRKGFVKTAYGLCGLILTIVLVCVLTPTVKDALLKTKIYDKTYEKCLETLEKNYKKNKEAEIAKSDEKAPTEEEVLKLGGITLPSFANKTSDKWLNVNAAKDAVLTSVMERTAAKLAYWIVCAMAYIVTFVVVGLLLAIVSGVLGIVARLPVISTANSLLGAVAGLASGLAIVWLLAIVMTMFANQDTVQKIMVDIYRSPLLTYLYENNGIIYLMAYFLG